MFLYKTKGINSCNEIEQIIIIFVLLYKVNDCFPPSSGLLKLFYIMKKLLLSLAMILSVMLVKGQYNIPESSNLRLLSSYQSQ